ncbi:MAG: hypothetical protein SGPRY_006804 [Prymnesium sp.]
MKRWGARRWREVVRRVSRQHSEEMARRRKAKRVVWRVWVGLLHSGREVEVLRCKSRRRWRAMERVVKRLRGEARLWEGLEAKSISWASRCVKAGWSSWLQRVAEWKLGGFKLRRAEVHRRRLSLRALLQASKMEARRVVAHRVGTSQRLARGTARREMGAALSEQAILSFVSSSMRRLFRRLRALPSLPPSILRSQAYRFRSLVSFKRGLQRWQLFCWRQLCAVCATQHASRKALLPLVGGWKVYTKLLIDLREQKASAARAMACASLLARIFGLWRGWVRWVTDHQPPSNSVGWVAELPAWQRLSLQQAELARQEAGRRLRMEEERAERVKTEAWRRHQVLSTPHIWIQCV